MFYLRCTSISPVTVEVWIIQKAERWLQRSFLQPLFLHYCLTLNNGSHTILNSRMHRYHALPEDMASSSLSLYWLMLATCVCMIENIWETLYTISWSELSTPWLPADSRLANIFGFARTLSPVQVPRDWSGLKNYVYNFAKLIIRIEFRMHQCFYPGWPRHIRGSMSRWNGNGQGMLECLVTLLEIASR